MRKYPLPSTSPAVPASKIAERLRAHARLCRQIARESWNEVIASELVQLADQCMEAADNIEPEAAGRRQ